MYIAISAAGAFRTDDGGKTWKPINKGLSPSPQADKSALLRRVSFDLTGLPPTPEEEASFLADSSPNAYEK